MSVAILGIMSGGSNYTLTVGNSGGSYGYAVTSYGSLTPTEFLGAVIQSLVWQSNELRLQLDKPTSNSGWTTISINGTVFQRASAAFTSGLWTWSGVTTNPIGTTIGAQLPVNIS